MVAALPCAIWKKELNSNLPTLNGKTMVLKTGITKWLTTTWNNIIKNTSFDPSPMNYVTNLQLAGRQGTLQVVEQIIKESE